MVVPADVAAKVGALNLGGITIPSLGHCIHCKRESPRVVISSPTGIGSLMCLALVHT